MLLIVGMNHVLLWTVLMFIASIIPAVGPSLILLPVALWLIISNQMISGFFILVGVLIISTTDNILRTFLMRNSIKMHDILITISMLGGISIFGFSGFIIGPISAGVFITFWKMFEDNYKKELKNDE